MKFQPRLNVGDSRGNNLTNGQRWNGKGTEVMRVELQHITCHIFYCSEQWDPHRLTAFQWGFRPLWRKLVNRKKRKQCTLCPINDNLAFRLNLHRCGTMHERRQYVPQAEWQVKTVNGLNETTKKICLWVKKQKQTNKKCSALAYTHWLKWSHFDFFERALE